jgi:hypothetical protein
MDSRPEMKCRIHGGGVPARSSWLGVTTTTFAVDTMKRRNGVRSASRPDAHSQSSRYPPLRAGHGNRKQ